MTVQLQLDGKTIGTIDAEGKIADSSGNPVESESNVTPKKDVIDVPLDDPQLYGRRGKRPDPSPEPLPQKPKEAKTTEGSESDETAALKLENKLLQRQIDALQQAGIRATPVSSDNGKPTLKLHIPENLTPEDDPLGVARSIRALALEVGEMKTQVNRLDQHAGFTEYSRALQAEKDQYKDVFSDPKIGPIADKLVDAELRVDPNSPFQVIVANVVKEVTKLGIKTPEEKEDEIKGKVSASIAVPRTLRAKSGAPPTISVNKPKNVKEAAEAYQQWRRGRARQRTGG